MTSLDAVRRKIQKSYRKLHNWRDVADEFNISSGMAFRIAVQNYEPKSPRVRHTLGLPTLIPAPACTKCGQVHTTKRCPNGKKPPSNWRDGEAWFKRLLDWLNEMENTHGSH